jgi:PAS domain S-box-containing protein
MKLLFQALSTAADGAFIVDKDQHIIYWNRAAERVLGHQSSQVLGRPCYETLNGQDGFGRMICLEHCAASVTALGGGQVANFDMSVRTQSGNPRWINMSTFVFLTNGDESGPVVVHLFRNVTQRKENEHLLQQVLKAAGELQDGHRSPELPGAPAADAGQELTDREREVLTLLVHGSSTNQMSRALFISTATVRNHIRNIMAKFNVHSRIEAVVYALKNGLITLDEQDGPSQQR